MVSMRRPTILLAFLARANASVSTPITTPAPPPDEYLPPCFCDSFVNGMDKSDVGKHGCMRWYKNNPEITFDHDPSEFHGIPASPGRAFLVACSAVDPSIEPVNGADFKGWQGGCPADQARCVTRFSEPEHLGQSIGTCACTHYLKGAHPNWATRGDHLGTTSDGLHLCVTHYSSDAPNGVAGEVHACTPPDRAYDEKFGEGFNNWGCDHPAVPCFPGDVLPGQSRALRLDVEVTGVLEEHEFKIFKTSDFAVMPELPDNFNPECLNFQMMKAFVTDYTSSSSGLPTLPLNDAAHAFAEAVRVSIEDALRDTEGEYHDAYMCNSAIVPGSLTRFCSGEENEVDGVLATVKIASQCVIDNDASPRTRKGRADSNELISLMDTQLFQEDLVLPQVQGLLGVDLPTFRPSANSLMMVGLHKLHFGKMTIAFTTMVTEDEAEFLPGTWRWFPGYCDLLRDQLDTRTILSNVDVPELIDSLDIPDLILGGGGDPPIDLGEIVYFFFFGVRPGDEAPPGPFVRGFRHVDWNLIIDSIEPCDIITGIHAPIHFIQNGDSFGGFSAASERRLGEISVFAESGTMLMVESEGGTFDAPYPFDEAYRNLDCNPGYAIDAKDKYFALEDIDVEMILDAVDWDRISRAFDWDAIIDEYLEFVGNALIPEIPVLHLPSIITTIDWLELLDAINIIDILDSIDYVKIADEMHLKALLNSINPEELLAFLDVPGVKLGAILDNIDFETIYFATSVRMVLGAINLPAIAQDAIVWEVFGIRSNFGSITGVVGDSTWEEFVYDVVEGIAEVLGEAFRDVDGLSRVFSKTFTAATLRGWSPSDIQWDVILGEFNWGDAFNYEAWDDFLTRNTDAGIDEWVERILLGDEVGYGGNGLNWEAAASERRRLETWSSSEESGYGAVPAGFPIVPYTLVKALAFALVALPAAFPGDGDFDLADLLVSVFDSLDICYLFDQIDWGHLAEAIGQVFGGIVSGISPSWSEFLNNPDYRRARHARYYTVENDGKLGPASWRRHADDFTFWPKPSQTRPSKPLVEPEKGDGWFDFSLFIGDVERRSRRLEKTATTKSDVFQSIAKAVSGMSHKPDIEGAKKRMAQRAHGKEKKERTPGKKKKERPKKVGGKIDKERKDKLHNMLNGVYGALRLRRDALRSGAKRPTAGRKLGEASAARAGADKDKPADGMLGRAAAWAKKTHVRASIASALGAEKKVESRWNHFELA